MNLPLSRENLASLVREAEADPSGAAAKYFHEMPRHQLLPAMFKIRGIPYSLEDYPQFTPLYDYDFVPNIIYLCGRQISKCFRVDDVDKLNIIEPGNPDLSVVDAHCAAILDRVGLHPGAKILSCYGGRVAARTVVNVWQGGLKALLHVRTEGGAELRISPEHRLKTDTGVYLPAGQLVAGMSLLRRQGSGFVGDPITDIDQAAADHTVDIEVEGTHNFLLDGIVSHNSTNLSRSEVLEAMTIPHFQLLYVAPLQQQSQRYSTLYLSEAIGSCAHANRLQAPGELGDGKVVKAVAHKSFSNGASIQLTYAKTSPDRARGITSDMIDFDEVQDHLADHIPIVSESISNSQWGVRRFTGTAKTTDNVIQYLFNQSTQSEWGVKCSACGHWNMPTKENHVLDMIHVDGPCCSRCRRKNGNIRRLDVRNGELIDAFPDKRDEFVGIHVPQIVVPAITEDENRWSRLIRKVLKLPPSIIYTEILGISSDVGVRLISPEDIENCCTLGSHKEMQGKIQNYAYRVLGVDWGISEISSYTVATVVGMSQQGEYHVLFGKRYVGMDIEEIIGDIVKMARAYKVDFVAPDFGVGFTNNALLRNRDMQVVQIQYVTQNTFLRFNELHGIARWMVDRNTALSTVFFGIRNRRIKFPAPEDSKEYTVDLLSPYEHIMEESAGILKKKFLRDPNRPDDFCHALTFAIMVLMYLTNDELLNLKPEHAGDYVGFPDEGVGYDVINQMSSIG